MTYERTHTKEAIDNRGEVFTPASLVNEMLDKLPQDVLLNPEKVIGDIAGCGNGNFLIEVLNRRMKAGVSHLNALKTIYGIDIDEPNVKECKERLSLNSKEKEIWDVLNHNIICADSLDKNHKGWKIVGYMWNGNPTLDITDFY
jgi:ribosomal protein L11 methylase PrmA